MSPENYEIVVSQTDVNETEFPGLLISDDITEIITIVNTLVITTLISLAGVVINAINIAVYIKMGFSDTVNISLLGLAISDLCSSVILLWQGILMNPLLHQIDPQFEPSDVMYLTVGGPIMCFSLISSWMMSYIAFERYLCIVMPLKVKSMITPKRSILVITAIYILMAISMSPFFYYNRLTWQFSSAKNKTLLSLSFADDRDLIIAINTLVNDIPNQIGSFGAVVICTVALVIQIKKQAKWRLEVTSTVSAMFLNDKQIKISKMIVSISVIFIISYMPLTISQILTMIEPTFTSAGAYENVFNIFVSFCLMALSMNATVNIYFYVRMSSKYRKTLNSLLFFKPSCPSRKMSKAKGWQLTF